MTRDELVSATRSVKPGSRVEASVRGSRGETVVYRGRFRPGKAGPFVLTIETDDKVTMSFAYPRIVEVREV